MKLKKKPKRVLITIICIIVIALVGFGMYKFFFSDSGVEETKVLHTIKKYGYNLKETKSKKYKDLFYKLEKVLKKDEVDEEEYVKIISEMFVYDFYTLNDKTAKTDVGGTDFIYGSILDNFLENAEDTFYKYVESNIYGQRKQKLPVVADVKIESVDTTSFAYDNQNDEEAYEVKVSWNYTNEDDYKDYQNKATLIFIHNDIRLDLVELK